MTKRLVMLAVAACLLSPLALTAQNAVVSSLRGLFDITKNNITATADILEEGHYAYQPTEDVRTAGQILAHVANAQFMFCSSAAGQQSPNTENFEQTATTKAQIRAALQRAFAYCDGVFANMTDDQASRAVQFFGAPNTAAGVLAFNSAHNYEHYGNLVTYMRMNGIVPPSSR
jgi:uncharacterized damage-inducible protein DinB